MTNNMMEHILYNLGIDTLARFYLIKINYPYLLAFIIHLVIVNGYF